MDAESDDGDLPEGNFMASDCTQTLVQPELLSISGISLASQVLDFPEPSERDSILLLDHDFCDETDAAIVNS